AGIGLGKVWKTLSKDEKQPFNKRAELDRVRYERELRELKDKTDSLVKASQTQEENVEAYV
ncbi:unnamed protein product, partial [Discosporangium mesarthrocarpum]